MDAGDVWGDGFIHLRTRSAYSLLEGAIKADVIGTLARDNGMPAVGLTDRANLFGALEFSVTTSGGGLSYCHPGMYGLLVLIEAVRQVRGTCGARQVPGCDVAIAHGNGGVLSSQVTVLLGSAATV